jgi:hypothetical protein
MTLVLGSRHKLQVYLNRYLPGRHLELGEQFGDCGAFRQFARNAVDQNVHNKTAGEFVERMDQGLRMGVVRNCQRSIGKIAACTGMAPLAARPGTQGMA